MAITKRIKDAASDLEAVQAKIDAQARALHEVVPDNRLSEDCPAMWIYMFSSSVDELIAAGNKLVEAINGAD